MATVTMKHVRQAGMCSRGVRQLFKENNWDWDDFLENGWPSERVRSLNTDMATVCAEFAEKEEQDWGR